MPHQRPSGPHEEPLQAVEGLGIQHIRPGGTILQPTGHRGDSRPLAERRCVVLTVSACGCGRWRMCWPTPRPKGPSTGWTPLRSRPAGRGVRRAFVWARTATVIADDQRRTSWGLTPCDVAGSMTRAPHATTSSTPASSVSPASRFSSTSVPLAFAVITLAARSRHQGRRTRSAHPKSTKPADKPATSTRPGASPLHAPSPTTNAGRNWPADRIDAMGCPSPTGTSPDRPPTGTTAA